MSVVVRMDVVHGFTFGTGYYSGAVDLIGNRHGNDGAARNGLVIDGDGGNRNSDITGDVSAAISNARAPVFTPATNASAEEGWKCTRLRADLLPEFPR